MKTFRTQTAALAAAAVTAAALLLVVPAVAQPTAGAGGHGPGPAVGHGDGPGRAHGFGRHGGGPGERGHAFGARHLARMAEFLELSESQVAQAKAIHEEARAEAQPLREASRTLHQELRALLEQESPEATAVGQAMIALDAHRDAMRQIHADAKAAFEALLTPEQLDKLETAKELRGAGRGHRGERRGGARGAGTAS
ncbi:MAG TPA: Spy/CpxP family protein refolding chaperone [Thermoanaerobaculia bacterium]|nr:Spy/CpxP family protein refolding chaperone [Thermoanaerobaculia bacterium]